MMSWRRWSAFVLWSAVVFAAVPYANDIQAWISAQLGAQALRLALSALLAALTVGLAVRLVRRRDRDDPRRLAWLAGLALAAFALMWRLEVDAEPAHLALYGVLAWLAFRALSVHHRDAGVYPAAAALTAIVGTLDEVFQWLLPNRFWDLGDVGLNVSAGVMVQLVIWKVVRPAEILAVTPEGGKRGTVGARSLRLAARLAICETLLLLLCVSNTPARIEWYATRVPGLDYLGQGRGTVMNDYGHLHADPEIGRFRSRLSTEELLAFDRQNGAEVAEILDRYFSDGYAALQRANPPSRAPFVYEAVGHLFFRQRFSGRARKQEDPEKQARLATAAYRENLILERYFSRSLELSKAALAPGQRQWLESRHRPGDDFESRSSEWLVTGYSEAQARWLLLALLAGLIIAERACSRSARGGRHGLFNSAPTGPVPR